MSNEEIVLERLAVRMELIDSIILDLRSENQMLTQRTLDLSEIVTKIEKSAEALIKHLELYKKALANEELII